MTYLHIAEMDEKQWTTLSDQINKWNDNDANNDICCMADLQKLELDKLGIEVTRATIYGLLTKRWTEKNESTAKFEPNGYLRIITATLLQNMTNTNLQMIYIVWLALRENTLTLWRTLHNLKKLL